jgi:hypothetical protein
VDSFLFFSFSCQKVTALRAEPSQLRAIDKQLFAIIIELSAVTVLTRVALVNPVVQLPRRMREALNKEVDDGWVWNVVTFGTTNAHQ